MDVLGRWAGLLAVAGNLGFAVAIVRTRALPRLGAMLVLAGAVVPIALAPLTMNGATSTASQVGTIAFLLLPVGWMVVGLTITRWRQPSGLRAGA